MAKYREDHPETVFPRYWRRYVWVPEATQLRIFSGAEWRFPAPSGSKWQTLCVVYQALPPREKIKLKYNQLYRYSSGVCARWGRRHRRPLSVRDQEAILYRLGARLGWRDHFNRLMLVVPALPRPERLSRLYPYARDYALVVCERWARRHRRYLPTEAQRDLYARIQQRLHWRDHGRVVLHYLDQRRFNPQYDAEAFSRVDFLSGLRCPDCGAPAYGYAPDPRGEWFPWREGSYDIPVSPLPGLRCHDPRCREVDDWVRGRGELRRIGKQLRVASLPGWRGQYSITPDRSAKLAIASVAMVDFAARVAARQSPTP